MLPGHWRYKEVNSLYEEGAENLHLPKPQLFTYLITGANHTVPNGRLGANEAFKAFKKETSYIF